MKDWKYLKTSISCWKENLLAEQIMKLNYSIVYVGSLNQNSNSYRRFRTLGELGHRVVGINIDTHIYNSIFSTLHYRLNIGPGIRSLNREVIKAVRDQKPDLLLVDNKTYITAKTLKMLRSVVPHIKIANLITDDPTGRYKNAWRLCLKTAGHYNIHFVQRNTNVAELKSYGARKVEICHRSFDPLFHRKIVLGSDDVKKFQCKVGFIGTHEDNREEYVAYLISQGIDVHVTGDNWAKGKYWHIIKPYYKGPSVYGEDYIKSINGMEIALHFLRHANRDEQDSRTFEIPACGTFMLAEESALHLTLFKNGEEAVFFSNKEQLLEQVRFYMDHPVERSLIAGKGMQRCFSSGYDHASRMEQVIKQIFA